LIQGHILHRVQERHAILHWFLERFAAGDEAHAAGAFVDDGGCHGFGEVAFALAFTAGVDEGDAAHVVVEDLVAAEVDGVAALAGFIAAGPGADRRYHCVCGAGVVRCIDWAASFAFEELIYVHHL